LVDSRSRVQITVVSGTISHEIQTTKTKHKIQVSYNMRPAIEFSAKHNIKPHLTFFKLEQLPEMIEIMLAGKAKGRLGVKFE
jgi:D-arabinose 1-dehydrogenase-like Zn-dependent alcohol dehydrogenase